MTILEYLYAPEPLAPAQHFHVRRYYGIVTDNFPFPIIFEIGTRIWHILAAVHSLRTQKVWRHVLKKKKSWRGKVFIGSTYFWIFWLEQLEACLLTKSSLWFQWSGHSKLLWDIQTRSDEMFWNYSHTFCREKVSGFYMKKSFLHYSMWFIQFSPSLFHFLNLFLLWNSKY